MRYYNPTTNTEAITEELIKESTAFDDMPAAAQEWFTRPPRKGFEWKCRNGKWPEEVPLPPSTKEQLHEQWKTERLNLVDSIVVEIDGLLFDGDEISQGRMARAAGLAETLEEQIRWILADNTVAEVTASQLKRAARAAGLEQEKLWIPEDAPA